MRRMSCLLAALVFCLAASGPVRADVKEGDVRSTQARGGTALREKPAAMSKVVQTLPYGTRVKVVEVQGLWAGVVVQDGTAKGWVRTNDVVEPTALTGTSSAAIGPGGVAASADITAAGRQFDGKQFDSVTERTWRRMSEHLEPYYKQVDEIEKAKPTEEEVTAFIKGGLLGQGSEDAAPKFAALRLLGASGDGTTTAVSGPAQPMLVATNDAQFVERLSMNFSPEQEYWLGRAVAASAIAEYGLDPDPAHQKMVRTIGASLVRLADRVRGTHGGWHFAVLGGTKANGVSGPGGFVLITRGAIDLCRNEDELAGIIAHEIAHVALKHGEAVLRRTRDFQAALKVLEEKVRRPVRGPDGCNICPDVAKLLGEASTGLAKLLNVDGYGSDYELEADWEGSLFLCEVGYRASALAEYLEVLPAREGVRWETHPSSLGRIEALRPIVYKHGCPFEADGGAQARLPRHEAVTGRKATGPITGIKPGKAK
jgi:beta-barrel assembly-enhancing protease